MRNKNIFSRVISGLIVFDSLSIYLFAYLLNLGWYTCLGYPWSIYFPLDCVWCWQSLPASSTAHAPPATAGSDGSVTQLEWLKLRYSRDKIPHTFTSDLAGGFWMFRFLSFPFFHSHPVKSVLLKQRELRKGFLWRVLNPSFPSLTSAPAQPCEWSLPQAGICNTIAGGK